MKEQTSSTGRPVALGLALPHPPALSKRGVKSIEVAGRLLQVLATHSCPIALNELSRNAGMPPSQAHRYLASLMRIGLVEQSQDRRYGLGPFAIEIGTVASLASDPLSGAVEKAHKLREGVDETIVLAIWSSSGPLIFQVEESSRPIVMTMKRGTVMPLLSTATGIVFCAFLPGFQTIQLIEQELEDKVGSHPIARSRAELEVVLAKVSEQGYAINKGHLLPDVIALAAPIFEGGRNLVGVLAVVGSENRIDPSRDPRVLNALLDLARR